MQALLQKTWRTGKVERPSQDGVREKVGFNDALSKKISA